MSQNGRGKGAHQDLTVSEQNGVPQRSQNSAAVVPHTVHLLSTSEGIVKAQLERARQWESQKERKKRDRFHLGLRLVSRTSVGFLLEAGSDSLSSNERYRVGEDS